MIQKACECGYKEFYVEEDSDEFGYMCVILVCRDCGTEHSVNSTSFSGVYTNLPDATED